MGAFTFWIYFFKRNYYFNSHIKNLKMFSILPGKAVSDSRILKSSSMLGFVPNFLHNFKGPRNIKQRPKDHTLKVSAPTCCHAKRTKVLLKFESSCKMIPSRASTGDTTTPK